MAKIAVYPPSLAKPVGFCYGFEVRGGRILAGRLRGRLMMRGG